MNNFEYIDLILLALIAAFIFLRLKGVLGRKTGFRGKNNFAGTQQTQNQNQNQEKELFLDKLSKFKNGDNLDSDAKKHFIAGAKIAYETIISAFAQGEKKSLKPLVSEKVFMEFSGAIDERNEKKIKSETIFVGIKSAEIEKFEKKDNIYTITVKFVSEIITCLKDKENKVIDGDPDKIKIVNDIWKFSRNMWSNNPTWYLVETSNWLKKKNVSSEDLKIWESFTKNIVELEDKELFNFNNYSEKKETRVLDLHGYSLEEANRTVVEFINESHSAGYSKLKIITGKGNRSDHKKNPYSSEDMSILKNSVPSFIKSNDVIKKIKNFSEASINDGGSGAFYIFLKKNFKE